MFYIGKEFDIQKNKEYKTLDGAKKAANKADFCVFDEIGTKLYPLNVKLTEETAKGALEENLNGSVNSHNENREKDGTIYVEEVEELSMMPDVTEEDIPAAVRMADYEKEDSEQYVVRDADGVIRRVFQGKLRLRRRPSMDPDMVCGVTMFEKKRVLRKHISSGAVWYETVDGFFVSGDPAYVEFIPDQV